MSRRWMFMAAASGWILFSMLLGDVLRVWESPASIRWHAIVPLVGLAIVWAIFAGRPEP